MNLKRPALLSMIVVLALLLIQCGKNEPATVRIYGSTTIEPFMKKAAAEFDKSNRSSFVIQGIGSKNGIDSLIKGKCEIAMSSSEISTAQVNEAKKNGIIIEPFLLGYDIIIPVVHPSNKVTDISLDQLREIYGGTIYRWSALGGADTAIDVVERLASSGTFTVWHHDIVPRTTTEKATILPSNSAVLAYLSEHTNAIGYISPVFMNPEVKPLKINGILITENDSLLSEYHLKRPLFLYANEKKIDKKTRAFIIFLIVSDRSRQIMREAGYYSNFSLEPVMDAARKMRKQ